MAKNDTSITSDTRKKMPSRGRDKRTLILESMREKALLGLDEDATNDACEKAWFGFLAETAVNPENSDSALCLRLITERGWAALKPSSDLVTFDFDPNGTPAQRATQILCAISDGVIPIDYGQNFIAAIANMISIEEGTELKAEIGRIKEKLGIE